MAKRLIPGMEESLLRAFLKHIPDGVYFKDRESRFVRISHSQAARFGLADPAEAINRTDFDMFSEEHAKHTPIVHRVGLSPAHSTYTSLSFGARMTSPNFNVY